MITFVNLLRKISGSDYHQAPGTVPQPMPFVLVGEARFQVLEGDATELAEALGAVMPAEEGGPLPSYRHVAFELDHVPTVGSYLVLHDDDGHADVCCILVVAGHGAEDLAVPGGPLLPGHALMATWRVEDLIGEAHEND